MSRAAGDRYFGDAISSRLFVEGMSDGYILLVFEDTLRYPLRIEVNAAFI